MMRSIPYAALTWRRSVPSNRWSRCGFIRRQSLLCRMPGAGTVLREFGRRRSKRRRRSGIRGKWKRLTACHRRRKRFWNGQSSFRIMRDWRGISIIFTRRRTAFWSCFLRTRQWSFLMNPRTSVRKRMRLSWSFVRARSAGAKRGMSFPDRCSWYPARSPLRPK